MLVFLRPVVLVQVSVNAVIRLAQMNHANWVRIKKEYIFIS